MLTVIMVTMYALLEVEFVSVFGSDDAAVEKLAKFMDSFREDEECSFDELVYVIYTTTVVLYDTP